MFEPNIHTTMNPFNCKIYDKNGYEVKEKYWRYFVKTGKKLTLSEAEKYINMTPDGFLEGIWIKYCKEYCS